MSSAASPITDQITEILAYYRTCNLKDDKDKTALLEKVQRSSVPAYFKEVLTTLVVDNEADVVATLYTLRQQENLRHSEACLQIERKLLEARVQKRQSR